MLAAPAGEIYIYGPLVKILHCMTASAELKELNSYNELIRNI